MIDKAVIVAALTFCQVMVSLEHKHVPKCKPLRTVKPGYNKLAYALRVVRYTR